MVKRAFLLFLLLVLLPITSYANEDDELKRRFSSLRPLTPWTDKEKNMFSKYKIEIDYLAQAYPYCSTNFDSNCRFRFSFRYMGSDDVTVFGFLVDDDLNILFKWSKNISPGEKVYFSVPLYNMPVKLENGFGQLYWIMLYKKDYSYWFDEYGFLFYYPINLVSSDISPPDQYFVAALLQELSSSIVYVRSLYSIYNVFKYGSSDFAEEYVLSNFKNNLFEKSLSALEVVLELNVGSVAFASIAPLAQVLSVAAAPSAGLELLKLSMALGRRIMCEAFFQDGLHAYKLLYSAIEDAISYPRSYDEINKLQYIFHGLGQAMQELDSFAIAAQSGLECPSLGDSIQSKLFQMSILARASACRSMSILAFISDYLFNNNYALDPQYNPSYYEEYCTRPLNLQKYFSDLDRGSSKENSAPSKPVLDGPSGLKVGQNGSFRARATDPDGDALSYRFSWGDGRESIWGGASQSHSYSREGRYCVKAQARDSQGATSPWSDCLWVEVKKEKEEFTSRELILYYDFENCKIVDKSNHYYSTLVVGDLKCVSGLRGDSFSFDGHTFIDTKAFPSLKDFSVTFWFNTSKKGRQGLVQYNKGSQWGSPGFGIYLASPNNLEFFYRPIGTTWKCEIHAKNMDFSDGRWHFVAAIRDSIDGIGMLYVDNKLVGTCDDMRPMSLIESDRAILLGRYHYLDNYSFFKGYLDEVRIYNYALNEEEISQLYADGNPPQCNPNYLDLCDDNFENKIFTVTNAAPKKPLYPRTLADWPFEPAITITLLGSQKESLILVPRMIVPEELYGKTVRLYYYICTSDGIPITPGIMSLGGRILNNMEISFDILPEPVNLSGLYGDYYVFVGIASDDSLSDLYFTYFEVLLR